MRVALELVGEVLRPYRQARKASSGDREERVVGRAHMEVKARATGGGNHGPTGRNDCARCRRAGLHAVRADAAPTEFWDDTSLERFFWDEADVIVRSGPGGDGAIGFVGRRPAGDSRVRRSSRGRSQGRFLGAFGADDLLRTSLFIFGKN